MKKHRKSGRNSAHCLMAHVTEKIFFRALCNTIVFQINNFIIFLKNYSKTGADDQLRTGLLSIWMAGRMAAGSCRLSVQYPAGDQNPDQE